MVGALAFFGVMSVAAAAAAAFPTACELGPAGYALACSQSWRETVVAGVLTANGLSAKYIENEGIFSIRIENCCLKLIFRLHALTVRGGGVQNGVPHDDQDRRAESGYGVDAGCGRGHTAVRVQGAVFRQSLHVSSGRDNPATPCTLPNRTD